VELIGVVSAQLRQTCTRNMHFLAIALLYAVITAAVDGGAGAAGVVYSLHVDGVGFLRIKRGSAPVLTARAFCRQHQLGANSPECRQIQTHLCSELRQRQHLQGVFLCEAPVFRLRGDWGPDQTLDVYGLEDGREVARDFARTMNLRSALAPGRRLGEEELARTTARLEMHLCAQDAVLCEPARACTAEQGGADDVTDDAARAAASRGTIALRLREGGKEHRLQARLDEDPAAVAARFCSERAHCDERRATRAIGRALKRALKRAIAREKAEAEEAREAAREAALRLKDAQRRKLQAADAMRERWPGTHDERFQQAKEARGRAREEEQQPAGNSDGNPRNLYAVLGVAQDAEAAAIRRAYRKLSLMYHPDKNPAPEARAQFVEVAEAYETLRDPAARQAYDRNQSRAVHASSDDTQAMALFNVVFGNGGGIRITGHSGATLSMGGFTITFG